jgi:hypothetical protein
VVKAAAGKLCRYSAAEIDTSKFDERMRELRQELMPDIAREIPVDPLGLSRETIADWVFPYFIRADILALPYQHRLRRLSQAIFALAALAVAVVAVQTNFWPGLNWLAAFEGTFYRGGVHRRSAFGAAVHGFSTQRQFRRHSERYRRMAGVLAQVQAEMTDATTIEQVRMSPPPRSKSCWRRTATGSASCDSTTWS